MLNRNLKENEVIIGNEGIMNYFFATGVILSRHNDVILKTTEKNEAKMFQIIRLWLDIKCVEQQSATDIKEVELELEGGKTKKCMVYSIVLSKIPPIRN